MVAHRAKRGDEVCNALCVPPDLGEREYRHEQQGRSDIKNQISPGTQNPRVRLRGDCLRRNSFCPGRCGHLRLLEWRESVLNSGTNQLCTPEGCKQTSQVWSATRDTPG